MPVRGLNLELGPGFTLGGMSTPQATGGLSITQIAARASIRPDTIRYYERTGLDRNAVRLSFDTKVIGPLMLAKYLAPRISEAGSFTLFSGVAAAKIAVGTLGVAITNGAAETLARSLALELVPIRVNAISPGVIDTGAWDALGEQGKADYFASISARNPARRIGTAHDIANGVLFALTSTFLTGQTLHIDGGEP